MTKLCPKCRTEYSFLSHSVFKNTGMRICSKCDNEKLEEELKKWGSGIGKSKPCKTCGTPIYWEGQYDKNNPKKPLERKTGKIHYCSRLWATEQPRYQDEPTQHQKVDTKKQHGDEKPQVEEHRHLLQTLGISEDDYKNDEIIQLLVDGDGEKYKIMGYEKTLSPDPKIFPIKDLKGKVSDEILNGIESYLSKKTHSKVVGFMKFQLDSINAILDDHNTIISSPTGTGKTEAFIIPIIEKILSVPTDCHFHDREYRIIGPHTLLIYPRTALADDQIVKIGEIVDNCIDGYDWIRPRAIHGGVSRSAKEKILERPPLILATTFDFVNFHLIIQDKAWRNLLKDAKIIVMDEVHSYTSYLGSNVYHLLKRMKLQHMTPQYIGSSATLYNPEGFFKTLFGLEQVKPIENPERRKRNLHEFYIMPKDRMEFMVKTTIGIAKREHQLLVFSDTHDDAENLAYDVRKKSRGKVEIRDRNIVEIKPHYAGINNKERKAAENEFKDGDIDALSCTSTLELGIDIGSVDAVISQFTNNYHNFVQRVGRAGRVGQPAYGISVFNPDEPTSHYFSNNINEYRAQKHEVKIQTENKAIAALHDEAKKVEEEAEHTQKYTPESDRHFKFARKFPFRDTSESVTMLDNVKQIKSDEQCPYEIYTKLTDKEGKTSWKSEKCDYKGQADFFTHVEKKHPIKKMGTRAIPVGFYKLHEKAICKKNMRAYRVECLKGEGQKGEEEWFANLIQSPDDINNKTLYDEEKSIKEKELYAVSPDFLAKDMAEHKISAEWIKFCRVEIKHTITGYHEGGKYAKRAEMTKHVLPNTHLWNSEHLAVRIEFPNFPTEPKNENSSLSSADLENPITHTVIHLIDNASKIITKADSDDIQSHLVGPGTFYLYDDTANGQNGYSDLIFNNFNRILEKAKELVNECDCEKADGCPKCTYTSSRCPTTNEELDKEGAKKFFNDLSV